MHILDFHGFQAQSLVWRWRIEISGTSEQRFFVVVRARLLNLQFLKTAFILKRGATKWVAHAPDFVRFTVLIHTIAAQNTSKITFLITWHRRHMFSSERALFNYKLWFCRYWTFSIFVDFRLNHWCENCESKLVKCSSRHFLSCIAGAFTKFPVFQSRIYFKTRCGQASCTCTRFRFFARFWYIPLKHRIHPKSFFNDLTSESERALVNYKLDFADIEHYRFLWFSSSIIAMKIANLN